MSESNKNLRLDTLSTKLKTVYIELKNFSFFHGPSTKDRVDNRLIGRKQVKERLKSVLLNNKNKSGTYLVTGMRGMGKTSIVNKVFEEISPSLAISWLKAGQLLVMGSLLCAINYWIALFFLLSAWGLTLYLVREQIIDWKKRPKQIFKTELLEILRYSVKSLLSKDGEDRVKNTLKVWVPFLLALTTIFKLLNGSVLFLFFNTLNAQLGAIYYFGLPAFLLLLVAISFIYFNWNKIEDRKNQRLYETIHIDIGQDNLTEKDILKQIVRSTHERYGRIYGLFYNRFRLFWVFGISFLFYLLFSCIYYSKSTNELLNQLKSNRAYAIADFLPSQSFSLDSDLFNQTSIPWDRTYQERYAFIEQVRNEIYANYDSIKPKNNFQKVVLICDQLIFIGYNKFRKLTIEPFERFGRSLIRKFFTPQSYISDKLNISRELAFIPYYPDYLFFILLFIFAFVFSGLNKSKVFGFPTHGYLHRQLERLDARVHSQVTSDSERTFGQKISFFFSFKRSINRNYPIAEVGEIESHILSIFNEIDQLPKIYYKPNFMFVFDELDKVEPRYQSFDSLEAQKESEHLNNSQVRTRQQIVSKILANLKHFFNTAKCKFIFIAGGEMYDAFLADTSDREQFAGTTFNQVFYIPSFYSDNSDGRTSDITSLTESYVCQFLGYTGSDDKNNLTQFYEGFFNGSLNIEINGSPIESDEFVSNLARVKILYVLKNFIAYLAYRSHGSPNKVTSLFDEFVVSSVASDLENDRLVVGAYLNHNNFYLKFDEEQQFTLGLINYLFSPLLLSQNRYLKNFGDKLLVSTSFLLDHLLKYHNDAFSLKTLELTPEIIAFNKAPQLRNFIKSLVDHISESQLDKIASGLFEFKFYSKIKDEIKFISKKSDLEAAAFNFTLDESFLTKNHYTRKLNALRHVYKDKDQSNGHIHSTAYINTALGDLYYYDQEYDNAIFHYMDAVQELRYDKFDESRIYSFIVLVRNMLKLGLSFEKQSNFDSAIMTYVDLSRRVLQVRDIVTDNSEYEEKIINHADLPKLIKQFSDPSDLYYLMSCCFHRDDIEEKKSQLYFIFDQEENTFKTSHIIEGIFQESLFKDPLQIPANHIQDAIDLSFDLGNSLESKVACFILNIIAFSEQPHQQGVIIVNSISKRFFCFQRNFEDQYLRLGLNDKVRSILYQKIFTFENLRLLYQPLLAKLSMLEKNNITGITYKNLVDSVDEFEYLTKRIDINNSYLIEAEFFNKVGDILYFKNSFLLNRRNIKEEFEKGVFESLGIHPHGHSKMYHPINALFCYLTSTSVVLRQLFPENFKIGNASRKLLNYFRATPEKDVLKKLILNVITWTTISIKYDRIYELTHEASHTLANNISDLGDIILATIAIKRKVGINQLKRAIESIRMIDSQQGFYFKHNQDIDYDLVFVMYHLSSLVYEKIGKHSKAAFQKEKILFLFNSLVTEMKGSSRNDLNEQKEMIPEIETLVLKPAIELVNAVHYNTILQEQELYRETAGIKKTDNFHVSKIIKQNHNKKKQDGQGPYLDYEFTKHAAVNSEAKELFLLIGHLTCEIDPDKIDLHNCNIHSLATINSQMNRRLELNLKAKIIDHNFSALFRVNPNTGHPNFIDQFPKVEEFQIKEFLITEAILCYDSIIENLNVIEPSFGTPLYLFAGAHYRQAQWCKRLSDYLSEDPKRENTLYECIRKKIEDIEVKHLSEEYQYQRALSYYQESLDVHRGEGPYHRFINKMYYLDDDFNDDREHFFTALERFKVNSNFIKKRMTKIRFRLEELQLQNGPQAASLFETYHKNFIPSY